MSFEDCGKTVVISRQLPKGFKEESVKEQAQIAVGSISFVVIVEVICSVFLKVSVKDLLSLFFALQMVVYLTQFKTEMPE